MAVEIFRFDDAGYETWLRAHRHGGYVVNRSPAHHAGLLEAAHRVV